MRTAPDEVLVRFILSEEEQTPAAEQVRSRTDGMFHFCGLRCCVWIAMQCVLDLSVCTSVQHPNTLQHLNIAHRVAKSRHYMLTYRHGVRCVLLVRIRWKLCRQRHTTT